MKTKELTSYLDDLLRVRDIADDSLNGLQVANSGDVTKVALAVDACAASMDAAHEAGADFLLVHHGLFWGKPAPIRDALYQRIRRLIESDMALYAAHLPLDLHPELGNNAQAGKVLGWPVAGEFGEYHGEIIGREVRFDAPRSLSDVAEELGRKLNCEVNVWDFGPTSIKRMGYVSGGGLSILQQAVAEGMDAFVTGEPGHSFYWTAKESKINVLFAGHYATETLGVKAVGEYIHNQFGLETVFIDLPTGH